MENGGATLHRIFCTDDDLVASTERVWMQGVFDNLNGLFERVVPQTDIGKKARMICRFCRAEGNHSKTAYKRHMTGEELTYLERKREIVQCPDCGEDMAAGSLALYW